MTGDLTEEGMRSEIYRLAPFHHKIELPYGLSTYVPEKSHRQIEYTRVSNLVKHAFPVLIDACEGSLEGRRVLDVACNCGGFSVEAAKLNSEYVLGIDIVDYYIEQANFVKRALGLERVDFEVMDIESVGESTVGLFDVTLCFGILYHMENPVRTMKRLASVTKDIMLVDTTVMNTQADSGQFFDKPLWLMNFPTVATAESKDISTSLWRSSGETVQFTPTEAAVFRLLRFLGFSKVEKLEPKQKGLEQRYYSGCRATFLASRT